MFNAKKLIIKIKEKGLSWFLRRIKIEINNTSKLIFLYISKTPKIVVRKYKNYINKNQKEKILYGIYDFDVNDITYNFGLFLVDLEFETIKRGNQGFVVIFVPKSGALNTLLTYYEYDSIFDDNSKLWRLNNLLLPLMALSEKCQGHYLLPNRSKFKEIIGENDIYPAFYDLNFPIKADLNKLLYEKINRPDIVNGLRASVQGILYVKEWLVKKELLGPLVVITLRNSKFDQARNSNEKEWDKFAQYLKLKGFIPVFIPDTDSAFQVNTILKDYLIFEECAWNIGLRIALYELAYLNFFSPNGCIVLAMFNKNCSYIAMNMLPIGSSITTAEAYRKVGHKIGENYKFSNSRQQLCFKSDNFNNIKSEFEQFVLCNKVNL
jgi:hypothetical protein